MSYNSYPMNNFFMLKVPVNEIAKAITTVKEAKAELVKIDESVHKLGTEEDVRRYSGEAGVQAREEELAKAAVKHNAGIDAAKKEVTKYYEAAQEAINVQVTPNGEDITGENTADFALLINGLLESPAKLSRVLEKHKNPAFMIAASKYAASRGWEGFEFLAKEESVRGFIDQVFNNLIGACAQPYGIAAMQYCEVPNEYNRIAKAYGIFDELYESGGSKLESLAVPVQTSDAAKVV